MEQIIVPVLLLYHLYYVINRSYLKHGSIDDDYDDISNVSNISNIYNIIEYDFIIV